MSERPTPRRALPPDRRRAAGWSVLLAGAAAIVLLVAYVWSVGRPATPTAGPALGAPTSAPSAPSSPRPSPVGGPRVILDESFDDATLDRATWNTCHWWDDEGCTIGSNEELQWYRSEQVQIRGGALRLTAVPDPIEASDGKAYDFRSGMVTTGPERHDGTAKLAFTYGTVEARLRVPAGKGLWSAMWLLPADEDSRPEIDVLEALGQDPATMIMHLHPADRDAESPRQDHRLPGPDLSQGWHDIKLDWAPGRLTFFADGVEVWRVSGDQVPAEPMYLIMNLAVGGVYPGDPDERTAFPATFAIDHVKITAAES
jgi:beta-glucanase (GH16 family)